MSSIEFYCYVDRLPSVMACPLSLVVVCFPDGVPNLPPDRLEAEQVLDSLESDKKLFYVDSYIDPARVNLMGYEQAVRPRLEILIPKLIINSHYQTSRVIKNSACPSSYYYPMGVGYLHSCPGLYAASLISSLKRDYLIKNHYAITYPEYDWVLNKGKSTPGHQNLIIKHGPIYQLHYWESLKIIPAHWLRSLRLDSELIWQTNPFTKPPAWWAELFPNKKFEDCLNSKQRLLLETLYGNYPQDFKQEFLCKTDM